MRAVLLESSGASSSKPRVPDRSQSALKGTSMDMLRIAGCRSVSVGLAVLTVWPKSNGDAGKGTLQTGRRNLVGHNQHSTFIDREVTVPTQESATQGQERRREE